MNNNKELGVLGISASWRYGNHVSRFTLLRITRYSLRDFQRHTRIPACDRHIVAAVALLHYEFHALVANAQVAYAHHIQPVGQAGPDTNTLLVRVSLQTEHCLREQYRGPGCPGLGAATYRVFGRTALVRYIALE